MQAATWQRHETAAAMVHPAANLLGPGLPMPLKPLKQVLVLVFDDGADSKVA
jgi:hypothetical protein